MKTKIFIIVFLLLSFLNSIKAHAEEFDVQLTPSLYAGGYNISCHGANTGSINLFISGGNAPYTYVWSDGNTQRNRSNLLAGYYSVVVTSSNGQTITRDITLKEPEAFQVILYSDEFKGGYNISESGGADGSISAEVKGGVPPYNFLWSNGFSKEKIKELTAGTYSVTIIDATNCSTSASTTLIEPSIFHLVSINSPFIGNSIFNTSCGNDDGSINLTVAGGTPPYTYEWSNGERTQNITGLKAGKYYVGVRDANEAGLEASITLNSSPEVNAEIKALTYSNGKNTSCYSCSNGRINTTNLIGVSPYSFTWSTGQSSQNIINLPTGKYKVEITDALGCKMNEREEGREIVIEAPDREDWTLNGNYGISSSQFIGTADNTPILFKVNNSEVFKLIPDPTLNGPNSYAKFSKLISAENGISLDASRLIKITYESTSLGNTVYYGDNKAFAPSCAVPTFTGIKHVFPGSLAAWTPVAGSATLKAGIVIGAEPWNGTGTIELQGTNELGAETNKLNINWYCGKDIGLCTNPLKPGKVSTGGQFEVGFPTIQTGVNVAANIKGSQQIGLRVEAISESGNIPLFNTQLISDNATTSLISGKIENSTSGINKELFSIKGDGETKIGNPSQPSLYISPSFDPGINSYVPGNVRIASLGNINSQINIVQADGNGELSIVNNSTLSSLGLWQPNGANIYRATGRVGVGTANPATFFDILVPTGEEGLNIETTSDPQYNAKLVSNSTVTKLIGGILKSNSISNEVFSVNSDGRTIFGNPNQPSLFIKPFLNSSNNYVFGNVGIGNENPNAQLQVGQGVGSISMGGFWSDADVWTTNYIGFNAARQKMNNSEAGTWYLSGNPGNGASAILGSLAGDLRFVTVPDNHVAGNRTADDSEILQNVKMMITYDGKVQIGTQKPIGIHSDAKLSVDGKIVSKAVYVTDGSAWADYVFKKDYKLRSIGELSDYIIKNGHLPEIPTSDDIEKNGNNIGDTQILLLKKIEELTIYIIEQNKSMESLKTEINSMKNKK